MRSRIFPGVLVSLTLVLCAGASACIGDRYPGSELLGKFNFTATLPAFDSQANQCEFVELPTVNFTFTGIFSRDSDGTAFFTLNDTDRAATFDGQIITTQNTAPRTFSECQCGVDANVTETLTVALLSRSQDDALATANVCPADPLGAGIPPVGGAITGPATTPNGFDAPLACGEMTDAVAADCICAACNITYAIQGFRQ